MVTLSGHSGVLKRLSHGRTMASVTNVVRLGLIEGFKGLKNEVIYCPPEKPIPHLHPVTVYFGGDVQHYPEVMSAHRDNVRYLQWNLINTAALLSTKFSNNHIYVILPSRMNQKTFSCFDNFVLESCAGVPDFSSYNHCIEHFYKLLKSAITASAALPSNATNSDNKTDSSKETEQLCPSEANNLSLENAVSSINIVGFSKGCVVLNQMIYELYVHHILMKIPNAEEAMNFFSQRVKALYWLDGGHSGSQGTWTTKKEVLEHLASLDMKHYVHVTPYQVKNPMKPWVNKECRKFVQILTKKDPTVIQYQLHFEDEEPSISVHFEVISKFK